MENKEELVHAFNVGDGHVEHPFSVSFFDDRITCNHCRSIKGLDKEKPDEGDQMDKKSNQMKIDFVEIQNFRKLKECRIDFDTQKTLLVGANNSGKTSAMVALRKFLLSPKDIELRDISIGNWSAIDNIGRDWEQDKTSEDSLDNYLPSLDVWLDVPLTKIHHVVHIIPSVDWSGGAIGVRLRYEAGNIDHLKADYIDARRKALQIERESSDDPKPSIEPRNLVDFLQKSLSKYIGLKAYSLDTEKLIQPDSKGKASVQELEFDALELDRDPFQGIINIREIPAMRDFSEGGPTNHDGTSFKSERVTSSLSGHVRSYYDQHIDNSEDINADDIGAFGAIQQAEKAFDKRLKRGFSPVLSELTDLGIPGINNPNIVINTRFKSLDGLSHDSAVQYCVSEPEDGQSERYLPESYAGLGYQNLIAMVFLLMRFRQDWVEPKKTGSDKIGIEPLQLIMIEEPEAHLHAQVQQVFIKKAYSVLRNHPDLGDSFQYATQLLVSSHSSHVAHEVDFSNLRYFRRLNAEAKGLSPTSTVVNLSNVFGVDKQTLRFVKRYIKTTDCDLFFADGVIFVEGQAERILVPHFIRHHFNGLWKRYISLIDIGGSHALRFEPLIKALGLTTLVITDLDAGLSTKVDLAKGGTTTRIKKAKPKYGAGQVTTNNTLKSWHPKLTNIDDLLELKEGGHHACIDDEYELFIAFQKSVDDPIVGSSNKLIPRTFEDALIYANFECLKDFSGSSTTNGIAKLVESRLSGEDLEIAVFDIVDRAEKAAFAIDCLVATEEEASLLPPLYISEGLGWLEEKLQESENTNESSDGGQNG